MLARSPPLDTNPLDGGEAKAFAAALQRRGVDTFVVPVARSDWLKVASAVFTLDFWKGTCRPDGPSYNWYLQKVCGFVERTLGIPPLIHCVRPAAVHLQEAFRCRLVASLRETVTSKIVELLY